MPIRISPLPLLLLFFIFGCAGNDTGENAVSGMIVPEIIDIGQVRANDSPIYTSFTIVNPSTVSVEIEEILSGCGCMVVDLPQKTIRPNESVEVPVKIDIFGQKGDFNTDMLVYFASGKSRHILITGKIIEDLWYSGQSIRFHIDLDQEVVSKDFTISTIDYPNVQFEFETHDSDIHLSELSRSVLDGETKILFRLTVQNANENRTSSYIDLIPVNADLPTLTVPVFYHHLSGGQKQYLATSQINLGGIKQNENIAVKVYGDQTFLRNVQKIRPVSKDNMLAVVSHAVPVRDSDPLEIILKVSSSHLNDNEIIRGSFTLYSHDNKEASVQVNGIILPE